MSIATGHDAIIRRIINEFTGGNIVLPNGPSKDLPRIVLQEAGGVQLPFGLDGKTLSYPTVLVRVETDAGNYSTEATTIVNEIVSLFQPGIPAFDDVTVDRRPDVRPALPITNGVYAVPVYVRGRYVY